MRFIRPRDVKIFRSVLAAVHVTSGVDSIDSMIREHTVLSRDHMTPEISLHLITKECPLWNSNQEEGSPFADPFWAFYWPGGQVLTRFILDNPAIFRGTTVLDVGSGCGASAIACSMRGAQRVIANDVDPVSLRVIHLNATANHMRVETCSNNLIGHLNPDWSTVLLGDMFYDENFRDSLVAWTTELFSKFKTNVFIGDPGRLPLLGHPIRNRLTKVAEYELTGSCKEENNGLTTGYVWKLDKG